jgi:hypothetical protein
MWENAKGKREKRVCVMAKERENSYDGRENYVTEVMRSYAYK